MNLSIQDIEYFLLVVDHGQISRAALACAVSQPALSKSLRRLEQETGLQLFERSTRSMKLTSAGLVFVEHARRLKAEYSDAIKHASELKLGKAGLLRIGATGATMDAYVMPALAALLPKRPALRVALTIDLSDALYYKLDQGDLDLVVAPTFSSHPLALTQIAVGQDYLRIAASNSHPLRRLPALHLADLVEYLWILPKTQAVARQRLASLFAESNLPVPSAALETDFISKGCLDLVSATNLLALVPASFLDMKGDVEISLLPLAMELPREISLLSRRNAIWTPLMAEFQQAVESAIKPEKAAPHLA